MLEVIDFRRKCSRCWREEDWSQANVRGWCSWTGDPVRGPREGRLEGPEIRGAEWRD